MPGVTKEQIARAREWDLLSYLQAYEPQELKKCGSSEYRTVSHDSLKISNGRWNWHSQGIGGRTALDYLIKVRGMGFVEAVEMLCGERGAVISRTGTAAAGQEMRKPFLLPEANRYGTAAVSYLQHRCIDAGVISHCIGKGLIYESRRFHNCVFVGRSPDGKARYATLHGVHGTFKMDMEGSDKRYSFSLPAHGRYSPHLAVAESPIDALSLATLLKMQGDDWTGNHYLSLGGTAPLALLQYLHDHPAITHVSLCLDNDRAGAAGMEKIREAVQADPELSGRIRMVVDNPPPVSLGKDYNELLQQKSLALKTERARAGLHRGMEK